MRILTFELSGRTAFFKRPDVNSDYYFTYGNIHRVALLGLFGAILGFSGYGWSRGKEQPGYPEFYTKLNGLKIGIVSHANHGVFAKKIQTFNNSVGYASFEQGGNLIVKEQWLENPSWEIYVLLEDERGESLADALMTKKCVYMPYLGKNDHPADITNVRIVEGKEAENMISVDSLFEREKAIFADRDRGSYYYEESLPVEFMENGMYQLTKFVQTDSALSAYEGEIVQVEERIIAMMGPNNQVE